jgi:hypothetical protein
VRNGGIVLGDKANHVPAPHVPQLYYFFAFSAALGWPALVCGPRGVRGLVADVRARMFGSRTSVSFYLFFLYSSFIPPCFFLSCFFLSFFSFFPYQN